MNWNGYTTAVFGFSQSLQSEQAAQHSSSVLVLSDKSHFSQLMFPLQIFPRTPPVHTHEMASSLFSPHEKQCPNWESANSCSPPAAATLKYPQTFLLLRKFSSCTVPELGLKP